ncbi:uncharacterized protein F5891DRAFT_964873, partial [Suillus fuscotomentosus]
LQTVTMYNLNQLLQLLQCANPSGLKISLAAIFRFISLATSLKNDILLVQLGDQDLSKPPANLSPSLSCFLSASCDISIDDIPTFWFALKHVIWNEDCFGINDHLPTFSLYGHKHGITPYTLYPPSQTCATPGCSNIRKLITANQRPAVLYTLAQGPIATYSIDLKCEVCNVKFHHSFWVDHKVPQAECERTYYSDVPSIIHIGGHQFVETAVVRMWRSQCLLSWTSMSNCACLYNVALSKGASPPSDFPFGFEVTGDHVWSGIVQLSLIKDLGFRAETLTVCHGGDHKDRFTEAIRARNLHIQMYGQEELRHYCSKCTILYDDDGDGIPTSKLSVVVTDGVTVGHPCCSVHNCHDPLLNNHDRFCLKHLPLVNTCAIIGCNRVVVHSMKTCDTPTHQAVEKAYTERGQARFQLQERLQRTFATTSQQPMARLRAQFGRKRTHNEQLIVSPCGMILAQEMFFGAEGVASVIEMIKHMFCDETIKPGHIFYDNNCTLSYMVCNDPYFQNVGLLVDVFHFKCKHLEEDQWCQEHCNPTFFDELKGDNNTWLFNSSIAEQTNVWFGGYHSICREMTADRYVFLLDEMIIQKNRLLKVKLASQKRSPGNWPL